MIIMPDFLAEEKSKYFMTSKKGSYLQVADIALHFVPEVQKKKCLSYTRP
jgi:hypothetical protein